MLTILLLIAVLPLAVLLGVVLFLGFLKTVIERVFGQKVSCF